MSGDGSRLIITDNTAKTNQQLAGSDRPRAYWPPLPLPYSASLLVDADGAQRDNMRYAPPVLRTNRYKSVDSFFNSEDGSSLASSHWLGSLTSLAESVDGNAQRRQKSSRKGSSRPRRGSGSSQGSIRSSSSMGSKVSSKSGSSAQGSQRSAGSQRKRLGAI